MQILSDKNRSRQISEIPSESMKNVIKNRPLRLIWTEKLAQSKVTKKKAFVLAFSTFVRSNKRGSKVGFKTFYEKQVVGRNKEPVFQFSSKIEDFLMLD